MNTKLKKGLTIGALVLICLLVVTTIVLACVRTNFNQFNMDKITHVTLYKDAKENTYATGEKVFTNTIDKFKKGTNENVLSALFQSGYSKEGKAKITTETKTFSSLISTADTTYVELHYLEPQTVTVNGEVYKNKNGNTVTYTSVLVEITNYSSLNQVVAYFRDSNSSGSNPTSSYQIKVLTHHKDLYNYISSLNDDGELM